MKHNKNNEINNFPLLFLIKNNIYNNIILLNCTIKLSAKVKSNRRKKKFCGLLFKMIENPQPQNGVNNNSHDASNRAYIYNPMLEC